MAGSSITSISLRAVTEKTGFMGRKTIEDQALCLKTSGGDIILRKSAVDGAGDSWKLLTRRLWNLAKEKGIPFLDETK